MVITMLVATAAVAQSRGPSGADGTFNCEDFDTQAQAQEFYDAQGGLAGPNPADLDDDLDGMPCESLSNGMAEDGTMMGGDMTDDTMTGGGLCPEGQFPATAPGDPGEGSLVCFDSQEEADIYSETGEIPGDEPLSVTGEQGDLDCIDFATQEEAQATYNADPSDPNGLDADGDGVACESTTSETTGTEYEDGTAFINGTAPETGDDPDVTADQYDAPETPETPTATETDTVLPDTGGPALLLPAAGLLLATGLIGLTIVRRRL